MNWRDAKSRIERLELAAGVHGPPGLGEAAELRKLELDYAARFAGEVDSWSDETVANYLAFQSSEQAARLGHLRHRALSPQQQAELRAIEIVLDGMTLAELDQYMLERARAAQKGPS
jgi:hypothetical protein